MLAIIKRNVNGTFRAREEQALAHSIFTHDVAGASGGNPVRNFRPGLPKIARSVDMSAQIVEAKAVDGGIGRAGIEVRSFDNGNFAPGLELRRRDVLPGFAVVSSEMN